MDNKISTYSPAFSIVSWVALIGGIVTYLLGLWNAEMQLNEKGYYFAVLVLGLFSAASYQKTVRDKYEGIPTTPHLLYDLPYGLYYLCCVVAGRSMECNVITQRKRLLWAGFLLKLVWCSSGAEEYS